MPFERTTLKFHMGLWGLGKASGSSVIGTIRDQQGPIWQARCKQPKGDLEYSTHLCGNLGEPWGILASFGEC